jgi:hypothetical protein
MHFLKWIQGKLKPKVGAILVRKNGSCEEKIKGEIYRIPLVRRYEGKREFLDEIKKRVKDSGIRAKIHAKASWLQFSYKHVKIHFEVWFRRRAKIEVGLHIETDRKRTERIVAHLAKNWEKIKKKIPDSTFEERWRKEWARIFELVDWGGKKRDLTEELLEEIMKKLTEYKRVLRPLLDKIKD